MNDLKMTHFFHRPKEEVFDYFVRPELFELWGAPEGMKLKVQRMENKEGGKYAMTHSGADGDYVCTGYFKEYVPNEKIVQLDSVLGPNGTEFFHDLECVTEFLAESNGTTVMITQRGFKNEKMRHECRESWEQCLAKLDRLFGKEVIDAVSP